MSPPDPLDYWRLLVNEDESLPLFEAAVSIAQDEYPAMDINEVTQQVDEMAARLRQRLPADAPIAHRLMLLNHLFFSELGFRGNSENYFEADNSYLNRVVERRCGLPITLALLYIEIGRQAGIPVHGVAFPGHYLVKARVGEGEAFIDVFNGGLSLTYDQLVQRLELALEPGVDMGRLVASHLQAAPPRETLARTLRNLKAIHWQQQEWQRLLNVQNRLVILLPGEAAERRDRGVAYAQLECPRAAIEDFEAYLAVHPDAEDSDALREHLAALRGAAGRLN
jgi:regulator of sirC expression with transglutaminase-like and TPR domain